MLRSVSGSNSSRGIAAVVGVGPRLGSAVARKFASEGYTIAILSRDLGTEAVAAGGGDRAGGQGAGVRAAGGLRRRPLRARGLRGRPLPRPRRGARLQRLRAAGGQRRRRRGRATHALPRRHPRRFPPRSRRLRRRGLPLRATGHPGHGGEGQGHHHLHGLLGVGHRLRRLLRSKLRQVCAPGVVPVAGQGVPAGRRAHCACHHRRRHRREEVADAEEQQGRQRRRRGGRGPGRGGAELLARPRPGQERVDARDGHPVAVLHVAAAAAAAGLVVCTSCVPRPVCVRGRGPGIVSPSRAARLRRSRLPIA